MKKFLFTILNVCTSFDSYKKITNQNKWISFKYFILIVIMTSLFIYPKYFSQKTKILFPLLDELKVNFPEIHFKNFEITSQFKKYKIIKNPILSIVIDPNKTFQNNVFIGAWLFLGKHSIQLNYKNQIGKDIYYNNPFIVALFTKLSKFENGTGVIDKSMFEKFKALLKQEYFSSGIFFTLNLLLITFFASFFTTILGYLYSQFIITSLKWKEIRNISFYAITPVLLFTIILYYLNLDITRVYPIIFVMYILFLCNAIYRFKLPEEEIFP